MVRLDKTPLMRIYEQPVDFPKGKIASKETAIFINTPTKESFIPFVTKKQFNQSDFKHYFMPSIYAMDKLFRRRLRINGSLDRRTYYKENRSTLKKTGIESLDTFSGDRNILFNMGGWNEIFENRSSYSMKFIETCEEYLRVLEENFKLTPKGYKSYMLIDVNGWDNDISMLGKKTDIINPILLIYYSLRKNFERVQNIFGNTEMVLITDGASLRIDISKLTTNDLDALKNKLKLFYKKVPLDDKELDREIQAYDNKGAETNYIRNAVEGPNGENEKVKSAIELIASMAPKEEDTVDDVEKVINSINVSVLEKDNITARDKQLRKDTDEKITQNNSTIMEAKKPLKKKNIGEHVATTNQNMHTVSFPEFDKTYIDKVYDADIMNNFFALSKASIPMHIISYKEEDTSDALNLKKTIRVTFEDENRVRHSVTVDVPIFSEGKFIYLNGTRKTINKQWLLKPLVKINEASVQISTMYNKVIVSRYGRRLSSRTERFRKTIDDNTPGVSIRRGDNLLSNAQFLTSLEYDELSKIFTTIKIQKTGTEIIFSQKLIVDRIGEEKFNAITKNNKIIIGLRKNNDPITYDLEKNVVEDGLDIVPYIISQLSDEVQDKFRSSTTGKKFIGTRVRIMQREIPLIILCGYFEGLTNALNRANVKYSFSDKRMSETDDRGVIQFSDGYLIYDKYPMENSLLINALRDVPTKDFEFSTFETREGYGDVFDAMYSQRKIISALDNFNDFMIDAITEDILKDMGLPTDFTGLLLHANKLLTTNNYTPESDASLYRVRSAEVVNVFLSKALANAYGAYRRTSHNKTPTKVSVRKDQVLKDISMSQIVEEYNTLNPVVEVEKTRTISPKGPGGLNIARAYNLEKRSYDKSQLGIMAQSSSPDGNVGIARVLTLEPNIVNARGYIEVKDDKLNELNDVNLYSPAEMITPLSVAHDDASRTAMAVKQTKHGIPVANSDPVIISNGLEQVIHHHLSKDYAVVAKQDGKIESMDEKTGIVIMVYKDGSKDAFNMNNRILKNSAGGFYLNNKLVTSLKVGSRFKSGEIIAADENYFTNTTEGNKYKVGTLVKVAVISDHHTFEDGTAITTSMGERMATKMSIDQNVVLDKLDNISRMKKIGDYVNVGDHLLEYESSSGTDEISKLLQTIGEEMQEEIASMGRRPIRAKTAGKIVDIRVYSTVETDQLSPSLKKEVTAFWRKNKAIEDALSKSGKTPMEMDYLITEPTGPIKTDNGKLKGEIVGKGVLIKFIIEYVDIMKNGDKLANYTALKSTIGRVIPKGYEAYTIDNPDEEISTTLAPAAINARMVPVIYMAMAGNKLCIELTRKLKEIYES